MTKYQKYKLIIISYFSITFVFLFAVYHSVIDSIIQIIPVILTAILVYISFKTYRSYHLREVQKKQIDLVLSLIYKIQKIDLTLFNLRKNDKEEYFGLSFYGNLITVTKKLSTINTSDFDNKIVYFKDAIFKSFEFDKYLYNPLLPAEVANALKILIPDRTKCLKNIPDNQDIILIDKVIYLDSDQLKTPTQNKKYCTNSIIYQDFITGMTNFSQVSVNWLKSKRIKDLNLI